MSVNKPNQWLQHCGQRPIDRRRPRLTVQHLSQQIFVSKTEILPLSSHNDVIEQIDSE